MIKKLNIVFEDEQILVVDKPSGLVVNRSQTIKGPTLQDELSEYFKLTLPGGSDSDIGGRAGIVHRLDRETSGLLIVAKTQEAFDNLQRQFAERTVKKEYLALVHGKVGQDRGSIDAKIARVGKFGKFGLADRKSVGAREARTDYQKISNFQFPISNFQKILSAVTTRSRINYLKNHAVAYTLLRLYPKTGRTHQIRVHAKSIGHPLVSDLIYGPRKLVKFDLFWCPRLFLHAMSIEFSHPTTGNKLTFKSNLPGDLAQALARLTIGN